MFNNTFSYRTPPRVDSLDHISIINELRKTCLLSQFSLATVTKLKTIYNNKSFYRFILILSGNINLNPRPINNHHPLNLNEWDISKTMEFYPLHLNFNSLLWRAVLEKISNIYGHHL